MSNLTSIPNWSELSAEDIVDYLGRQVFVPSNRLIYIADFVAMFGKDIAEQIGNTIDAAAATSSLVRSASIALSTVGMTLSDEIRQEMIDDLSEAGSWPEGVTEQIKLLGGFYKYNWERHGYGSLPSVIQIETELSREIALASVIDKINDTTAAANTAYNNGKTGPEIIEAAENTWDGE